MLMALYSTDPKETAMRIVAINGSPTGSRGSTGRSLAALIEGAREAGAEVTLFELGTLTVNPCTSCHTCQTTGRCTIRDDCPAIQKAMHEADGLVLASPNYIYNVSAQLKALLDRCFSMFHCQTMHGTYGACIIASGGPRFQQVEEYLLHVIGSLGCWKVGSLVVAGGQLDDPDEAPRIVQEARALGRTLTRTITSRARFPEQEAEREECFEIMRWLVESQKDLWPYEYQYWQTRWSDTINKPG
jgi:multimeric flavodoxin WrbA